MTEQSKTEHSWFMTCTLYILSRKKWKKNNNKTQTRHKRVQAKYVRSEKNRTNRDAMRKIRFFNIQYLWSMYFKRLFKKIAYLERVKDDTCALEMTRVTTWLLVTVLFLSLEPIKDDTCNNWWNATTGNCFILSNLGID